MPRNLPGVSCVRESIAMLWCGLKSKAPGANPVKRFITEEPKCEVPNVILSKMPIASSGNTAQSNVARRAQPETNSSQP